MKVPADVDTPSPRPYRGLGELDYPLHDWAATVTTVAGFCFFLHSRFSCSLARASPSSRRWKRERRLARLIWIIGGRKRLARGQEKTGSGGRTKVLGSFRRS